MRLAPKDSLIDFKDPIDFRTLYVFSSRGDGFIEGVTLFLKLLMLYSGLDLHSMKPNYLLLGTLFIDFVL